MPGRQEDDDPFAVADSGLPIVEYANRRELSIEARIRLFGALCDAVEHAHSNLIPHGAIEDVSADSSGVVRLPDSGRPPGEPLDTSADVYALGLLLFELLSGERPDISPESSLPEPSELADGPTARILKGDLDAIVLRAMAGEAAERYPRVADLAMDLRLYLQHLPVQARSGGRLYRIRKFAGRNRGWRIIAMVLAIGTAASIAIVEARHAQRRIATLHSLAQVRDAVGGLPAAGPAREAMARQQLQSLESISHDAENDPVVKRELAEAYLRLGDTLGSGSQASPAQPAEARAGYRKAVALLSDIARSAPSDMRAQTDLAYAKSQLAAACRDAGDIKGGIDLLQEEADSLEALGGRHPLDASAKLALARTYFGIAEFHRAIREPWLSLRAQLRSIEILRDLVAKDPNNREAQRWYATSEQRLAALYMQLNQPAQAAESLDTAIQVDKQRVARNSGDAEAITDLTLGQTDLAGLLRRNGDLPGAEKLFETAISEEKSALETDPGNYRVRYLLASDYEQLGDLLGDEKRPAEARAKYLEGSAAAAALGPRASSDPDAQKVIASLRGKAGEAGLQH